MAQEQTPLYNFYFRYKWNEDDFLTWQTSMVGLQRAAMEGLFGGAVMGGFELTAVSGMVVEVADGIAIGPTGYLMVENDVTDLTFAAPVSNVRKDLIVVRPLLVDSTLITRPTTPFDNVYLKQLQDCQVVVIPGTAAANAEYPAKLAGDIIIAGVRIQTGAVALTSADFDFSVREIYGKNSDFQQNFGQYDDRMRPYRIDYKTLGIKPSQLVAPRTRAFSFVNRTLPSIFPKDGGGLYSHADTYLDFKTGGITGGDASSADFIPTIPTSGNWIVATVSIGVTDLIVVGYGTQGTRAQCLTGISNQAIVGAGCVSSPTNSKIIAFVMVKSSDGVNINELEFVDCRASNAVGSTADTALAAGGFKVAALNYTVLTGDNGKVLLIDSTAASGTIQLPVPAADFKFTVLDVGGVLNTNKVTLTRYAAENIQGLAANFDLESNNGSWNVGCNGTNWILF